MPIRWLAFLFIGFTFGVGPLLYAETPTSQPSPLHPEKTRERIWHDFTSFLHPEVRPVLEAGAVTTVGLFLVKWSFVTPMQDEVGERKPLGHYSHAGDVAGQWVPNVLYYGGMLTASLFSGSQKNRYRANYMLRSTLYAGLLSVVMKTVIKEERPNRNDSPTSFPSGHATTAFAFAGAVMMQHEWYWAVPAFALASFVGFSRMNDSYHYLHDVVGGATIGLTYAMGLYYWDRDRGELPAQKMQAFHLMPMAVPEGAGLVARYDF